MHLRSIIRVDIIFTSIGGLKFEAPYTNVYYFKAALLFSH